MIVMTSFCCLKSKLDRKSELDPFREMNKAVRQGFKWMGLSLLLIFANISWAHPNAWSHLELGAANYGTTPILASAYGPEYLGGASNQFKLLFVTVDKLVRDRGPIGTVYVNDLDEKLTKTVAQSLRQYCLERGYRFIQVVEVAGDFTRREFPHVQSAHLKNPESHLLRNKQLKKVLQRLADFSDSGLEVWTWFTKDVILSWNEEGRIWRELGEGSIYIFPNGDVAVDDYGVRTTVRYVLDPRPSNAKVDACSGRLGDGEITDF